MSFKCPKCKKIMNELYQQIPVKSPKGAFQYMARGIFVCNKHGVFTIKNGFIHIPNPIIHHVPFIKYEPEWKAQDLEV